MGIVSGGGGAAFNGGTITTPLTIGGALSGSVVQLRVRDSNAPDVEGTISITDNGSGNADIAIAAASGGNGSASFTASDDNLGGGASMDSLGRLVLTQRAGATTPGVACQGIASPFLTSGALPTKQFVSGTAAQLTAPANGRDCDTHTPVTFNPGVATTATCTVEVSPDNVTYSVLAVITKPVGTVFDGEIDDVTVHLLAGWYLRLTVVNATLGVTTYY